MDSSRVDINPYCRFTRITDQRRAQIQREDVVDLSRDQKSVIFGDAFTKIAERREKNATTLTRLRQLAPSLSSCLTLKAAQVDDFAFRLIQCPNGSLTASRPSYVALSYRWATGKHGITRTDSQHFYKPTRSSSSLMPIPPMLYGAVLSELDPESEGLWCDQACINQADAAEKAVSVAMMNVVYSQARYVAVVLADVTLTFEEQRFLGQYAPAYLAHQQGEDRSTYFHAHSQPPLLTTQPLLRSIYLKIMRAEWFQRCWCSHEMRMSRHQIFFVPCADGATVFQFGGPFLFDLILLAAEVPHPWTAVLLRPFAAAHHTVLNGVFERPYPNMILEPFEHINGLIAGGDPDPRLTEAERAVTAVRDKLSITLNTMQLDLAVDSHAFIKLGLQQSDASTRLLSALALALDDPLVLCTSGPPLSAVDTNSPAYSWLRKLNRSDLPANQQSTEETLNLKDTGHITVSATSIDDYICLPLCHLACVPSEVTGPSKSHDTLASLTLQILLHDPSPADASSPYPWRVTASSPDAGTRRLLHRTLACLLALGPQWIVESLAVTKGGFTLHEELRAALAPYGEGHFPGVLVPRESNPVHEKLDSKTFLTWLRSTPAAASAMALTVQFAIFVLQRALPGPWTPDLVQAYDVVTFRLDSPEPPDASVPAQSPGSPSTDPARAAAHLLVLPTADAADARLAVPRCLVADPFYDMCRVWLLHRAETEGTWRLQGRARVFGPRLEGLAEMEQGRGVKVYGPLRDT